MGYIRVTDFETQERQDEILALVKMMQYAGGIAGELEASRAASHIKAAQVALLSILEAEFPMLSRDHWNGLISEPQGHC